MAMLDEKLNVKSVKQTDAERELAEKRMLAANYARFWAKRAEEPVASTTVLEPQIEQEQSVAIETELPEMSSPEIAPADVQEQLEMKRRYYELMHGKSFASELVMDEPVASVVVETLPEVEEETDDSRPSPETMRHIAASTVTISAPAVKVAPVSVGASVAAAPVTTVAASTEEKQGFLSMLSMKTKMILLAVVSAIVLAIVLICINSSIISAANSSIATKQQRLEELQAQYETIQEQIAEITDPENVAEWALEHGMTQG